MFPTVGSDELVRSTSKVTRQLQSLESIHNNFALYFLLRGEVFIEFLIFNQA